MDCDIAQCVTDTPLYRAVCDVPRDNLVVTDTPRYITRCVTDIDGGQVVFDGPRDNPVVTDTPQYITWCVTTSMADRRCVSCTMISRDV